MRDKIEPPRLTSSRPKKTDHDQQDPKITELNEEILKLREQLFKTRDELQSIKNSRVLGKVLRVRNRVGRTITNAGGVRGLPIYTVKRTLHKVRITIAPLFPEATRTSVKSTYRKSRSRIKSLRKQVDSTPLEITEVTNKAVAGKSRLISVVIPYYNRADTIDETIQSLRSQIFKDFELIIVDDGSPDIESQEKLNQLNLDGLDATVVAQENQGVAAARNNGIRRAKGRYIICLDSDDVIEPTFIEKALYVLETQPDIALVTTNVQMFGVMTDVHINKPYDPMKLMNDNMVITAAAFRKVAWEAVGGYKPGIGYEDWEYWLNLAENGYWGMLIEEELFVYRTSLQSRYVEDKDIHWNNLKAIKALHPNYRKKVRQFILQRRGKTTVVSPESAFINLSSGSQYNGQLSDKSNVLITMPWMTFGGAETLVYNYCRELKDDVNISFITGIKSKNEWEYKFRTISSAIYHLRNLFEDPRLDIEFISNYIATRNITILHIVHNGFIFGMLPELKKRHPSLKVLVTLFNDRVPEYVEGVVKYSELIDEFVTDNNKVKLSLSEKVVSPMKSTVIPNGIDVSNEFNPALFSRTSERSELNLREKDIAVFFVGRLSEEKNPDVFIEVANQFSGKKISENIKFFMIGDGPMRGEIEKSIKNADKTDISYLGYQSSPARFLSAADIFVLPSSIEGFPLSVLEAMAMELVVIASDVGAVAEVVDSGTDGFVVRPGSVKDIAQAINILLTDGQRMNKIKKSARKSVETKYSNQTLGKNYRKLYRGN